ncbi:MAG TPA: Uma2 family endonuclease [Gemmataceae bacterium]|nr:Uma2 family endonuclease [Gemmataceae bacterium]
MPVLTLPATPLRPVAARPTRKRFTVREFHEMWEAGWFDQCKPMLIAGEVYEMAKPGPAHNTSLTLADYIFKAIFAAGYVVRIQMPLVLGQTSDPEPDLAVVGGSPRDYATHPSSDLLVVEVADTSLDMDTGAKAQLYAAAGIADYWVIDLDSRQVIVYRDPRPDPGNPFGASYATVKPLPAGQAVAPLAAPQALVNVADMLP